MLLTRSVLTDFGLLTDFLWKSGLFLVFFFTIWSFFSKTRLQNFFSFCFAKIKNKIKNKNHYPVVRIVVYYRILIGIQLSFAIFDSIFISSSLNMSLRTLWYICPSVAESMFSFFFFDLCTAEIGLLFLRIWPKLVCFWSVFLDKTGLLLVFFSKIFGLAKS